MTTDPQALVAALREKMTGGQTFMACRHYDIDDGPRDPNSRERQCVIDLGCRSDCEFARNAPPTSTKEQCDYWLPLEEAEPALLTIKEGLSLVQVIEAQAQEIARLNQSMQGLVEAAEKVVGPFASGDAGGGFDRARAHDALRTALDIAKP